MSRTAHDTDHTLDDSWPLALGVDARGASIHACVDCGAEIPDGALAERDAKGRVVAWTSAGTDPATDDPIRNIVHQCTARKRAG